MILIFKQEFIEEERKNMKVNEKKDLDNYKFKDIREKEQ